MRDMSITVSAFYKFARVEDCARLRDALDRDCRALGILGTILVAPEGINGTVSGTDAAIRSLHALLRADPRFTGIETKESLAAGHPFGKLKIKVKPEIVTFGVPEADPTREVGTYVQPEDWNALISSPDVVVIDTRNSYEFTVGTFAGAIDPGTRTFTEFPAWVRAQMNPTRQPRVAMFCTGGIRCEKATAFMLAEGFREVYHLKGGILRYLETVPESESLWRGKCFVFDDRVSLGHGLRVARHGRCPRCGQPIPVNDGSPSATCMDCGRAA
jgi:UPF0176 protein